MRALLATPPGLGHFLQLVPTAWGLRADGHDVLVVSTGPAMAAAASAGLSVADCAREVDIAAIFRGYMSSLPTNRPADAFASTTGLFAQISDAMAEGTVDVARAWRPDLVVYSPLQGAGPLAAQLLGVPAVHHGIGLGLTAADAAALGAGMAAYARYGTAPPTRPDSAVVDLCPASLRRGDELAGWPTRFVPYGGGGPVADPHWRRGSRPRVCVTLGSVAPRTGGLGALPDLVKACGELPVEIALALGGTDAGALGPLPDNVHQVGWTPLSGLLAGCSAIIHHGGSGTTFNALAAGVPQLALPQFGDQFRNSAAIVRRGVGLAIDHDDVDGPSAKSALGQLLDDPAILAAAAEVRAEMARTQSPVTLPALLAGL